MKKLLVSVLAIGALVSLFYACKEEEPLPDPNKVLAEKIAQYRNYTTKETDAQNYTFVFYPSKDATDTEVAMPATFEMRAVGTDEVKSKGTWEVRDSLLWLMKSEGWDWSKTEGGVIQDEGRELYPKTGSRIVHLYVVD